MRFKPWLDVPPPRHELHDDSSSDEDQHLDSEPEDEDIAVNLAGSVKTLIIVSPSIEPILLTMGKSQPYGSITVSETAHTLHELSEGLVWVKIPQVSPTACYPLARAILEQVRPELTIILTPLFVDPASPIKALLTSNTNLELPKELILEPPHFITGIAAALLSYAEISKAQAIALIVNAEGVPDHEYVEEEAAEALASLLSRLTTGDLKLDLEALRRHRYRSSGMYV